MPTVQIGTLALKIYVLLCYKARLCHEGSKLNWWKLIVSEFFRAAPMSWKDPCWASMPRREDGIWWRKPLLIPPPLSDPRMPFSCPLCHPVCAQAPLGTYLVFPGRWGSNYGMEGVVQVFPPVSMYSLNATNIPYGTLATPSIWTAVSAQALGQHRIRLSI